MKSDQRVPREIREAGGTASTADVILSVRFFAEEMQGDNGWPSPLGKFVAFLCNILQNNKTTKCFSVICEP